jgi:hypothetical protein
MPGRPQVVAGQLAYDVAAPRGTDGELTPRQTGDGYTKTGMAIVTTPNTPGPITFEAILNRDALVITNPASQLTFVLAYVGDSRGAWPSGFRFRQDEDGEGVALDGAYSF